MPKASTVAISLTICLGFLIGVHIERLPKPAPEVRSISVPVPSGIKTIRRGTCSGWEGQCV